MTCNCFVIIFLIFGGPTDRQTDRQTDGQHLLIKSPRRRLKKNKEIELDNGTNPFQHFETMNIQFFVKLQTHIEATTIVSCTN